MKLEEMKLAVCRKLPHLVIYTGNKDSDAYSLCWIGKYEINWPTEGLQVCHEAEKLLTPEQQSKYVMELDFTNQEACGEYFPNINATYEQRLEALCRVWFPERFNEKETK